MPSAAYRRRSQERAGFWHPTSKIKEMGGNMVKVTKQYSSAASQAGKAVEKTAYIWTRGVR